MSANFGDSVSKFGSFRQISVILLAKFGSCRQNSVILSVKFGCFVQATGGRKRRSTGPAGQDGGRDWGFRDRIGGWVGEREGTYLKVTHQLRGRKVGIFLKKLDVFRRENRYLSPLSVKFGTCQ